MSDVIGRHGVVAWLDNMGYPKLADIVNDKKRFPSAEPERKKGKWVYFAPNGFKCSECDRYLKIASGNVKMNFCPNCGSYNGR